MHTFHYTWENDYSFKLKVESELHLGGPWGRPVGFNGSDQMKVYNKTDNTWHNSVTATYTPYKKLQKAEFSVYYDWQARQQIKDSYDTGSGDLSYREDVRYYATQNRIAPSADGGYVSPSYCLFGASAGFIYRHRGMKWDFKLKGDNLADNKYRPFETLVYGMGRNFKIMATITF